ncbi:MAG TPA: methyltransferase domain-containing protein [Microvirga sp.]|jgi:SAM-dependent methyltransferase|nr:methyltransferase domain-containing protein [Microvirga sp.]
MNWREYWNQDTPIYASERHKVLHYAGIARDIAALIPSPDAVVLDHGSGEALSADRIAARCARLYLLDAAPLVRERLERRFGAHPKIAVIAPEDLEALPDRSLDLVVANSLLQYLGLDEFRTLLALWRRKLKADGRLVLADVIPPEVSPVTDARALLAFAWTGGFVKHALMSLARTALSDYRKVRDELGLSQYAESEMIEILRDEGYRAERLARNIGHNQARMTFSARPL